MKEPQTQIRKLVDVFQGLVGDSTAISAFVVNMTEASKQSEGGALVVAMVTKLQANLDGYARDVGTILKDMAQMSVEGFGQDCEGCAEEEEDDPSNSELRNQS